MPLALYFGEYSKVKHQRCILLMGHDFPLTKEELIGWGGLNYYSYWMQQGRVVCEYYATHTEYDEDGNLKYVDRDGNGVLNNDDKFITGDPNPDFTYGLNSDIRFKDFEFSFFFQGSQGNDVFNVADSVIAH